MNFEFKNITPFKDFNVDKTYLVLFHVDKFPPHLGIVQANKYYSITIKEVELGLKTKSIIGVIQRKKIPSLILEIDDSINNIAPFYLKYSSLQDGMISCQTPIKEYFSTQNDFKVNDIKVVFDLLDSLIEKVRNVYQLNLDNKLSNNCSYLMERYSLAVLENHLQLLRDKNKVNV
jgi:hypothetical protein